MTTPETQIDHLAAETRVSSADAKAFVACLQVWIAKGYSLEQAIERHMAQMARLVAHCEQLCKRQARAALAGAMWDDLHATAQA